MAKNGSKRNSLRDPIVLQPRDPDEPETIQMIIETPKGSRNKYFFDPDQKIFALKKALPAGMAFPYDFGFIPSTKAEDGEPTDVLVLMDEPAFPGCLLKCRMIGIIEAEQRTKKGKSGTMLLLFPLMFFGQRRACRKDRRKRQKHAAEFSAKYSASKPAITVMAPPNEGLKRYSCHFVRLIRGQSNVTRIHSSQNQEPYGQNTRNPNHHRTDRVHTHA